MNEPHDPRPLQTVNRLRLVVFIPVLVAVVGVGFLASKLALRFRQIEEPPARDYPPGPPPRAGASGQPLTPVPARPRGHPQVAVAIPGIPAPAQAPPPPIGITAAAPAEVSSPFTVAPISSPLLRTGGGVALAVNDLSPNGIVGRVLLRGTPPPEKEIPMDPSCSGVAQTKGNSRPMTRFFVVDADGGLADVFLWLFDFPAKGWEPPAAPLEIRQRGCEYHPYVSAAQTGQTIRVFNDDPLLHNVHATPDAPGNLERNLAQLPGAAPLDFSFTKPELFLRFKCDVHPWMFSYVNVVPHPFFAVTGTNGSFVIPEPPPGDYQLQILHRKTESRLVKLSVRKGQRLVVNVVFDVNNPGHTTVKVTEE